MSVGFTTEHYAVNLKTNKTVLNDFWIDLGNDRIAMYVDEAADDFYTSYHGTIYGAYDFDSPKVKVGRIEYMRIDLARAMEAHMSPYDVLDGIDQDTYNFGLALLDSKTNEIRETIGGKFVLPPDILIIFQQLQILPEFRGNSLGLLATYAVMKRYCGGYTAFVLKPFPLQFDDGHQFEYSNLDLHEFKIDSDKATTKLREHYSKLGFWQVDDTEYFFFSNDYSHPVPKELKRE